MFEQLLTTVVHTALFSGFCYTQFADTFQEANGLLRADRTPKIPLARIAECTPASRMHITGAAFRGHRADARARQDGRAARCTRSTRGLRSAAASRQLPRFGR